jgi:hypothetical protein
VAGFTTANVSIAAAATTGTVSIQIAPTVKPGDYTLTLSASLKQNTRPVKLDHPIAIKVIAP